MKQILKNQFIDYLIDLKKDAKLDEIVEKESITLRVETTSDEYFDLIDKQQNIIVAVGQGSASYSNPNKKTVEIIDYEDLINQLPQAYTRGIKRSDFILYQADGETFFIVNELSQSSKTKNKLGDAKLQLANTVMHLMRQADTKCFIEKFSQRVCIFSNKKRLVSVPDDAACAFERVKSYLPDPLAIQYQPITKHGFLAFETAKFDL